MAADLIGMLANPAWLAAFGVAIIVPLFGFLGTLLAHRPPPAQAPKPDLVSLPEHPLLLSATAKLCAEDRAVLDAILARLVALGVEQASGAGGDHGRSDGTGAADWAGGAPSLLPEGTCCAVFGMWPDG